MGLLNAMDSEIDITRIFQGGPGRPKRYRMRGLISYYLQHYAAYFFNDTKQIWFSFDDRSVQPVGPTWKDVIRKCKLGHAKPVLVFYEEISSADTQEASPVVSVKHRTLKHWRGRASGDTL